VQADKFVYRRRLPFARLEEALTASPLLSPFDIASAFAAADKKVKALAGADIKEIRREKGHCLNGFKEIKKYAKAKYDENLDAMQQYAPLFKQFDLKEITRKMRIRIVGETPHNTPCFFKYDGNYRGTMGIMYAGTANTDFLDGFVMHEGVPGHFLYYCIKQYLADKGRGDAVTLLDTLYSPENCLNEGLAVCSHLIFDKLVQPRCRAMIETQKILHKIFYNLWYSANIRPVDTSLELRLLARHFSLSGGPRRLIKYFTKDEKYYTPYYPYGIYYGESLIPRLKPENKGFLYHQHSVNTLKKLIREQA
jgi:hypothetical protein